MSHGFLWIIILILTFRYDIAALREHITTKLAELSVIEEEVLEVSSIILLLQYLCLKSEVLTLVVQSYSANLGNICAGVNKKPFTCPFSGQTVSKPR